jgi:hypothetical protein
MAARDPGGVDGETSEVMDENPGRIITGRTAISVGNYLLALMERAPHFHIWLVPKKDVGELRGVAYMAQTPH